MEPQDKKSSSPAPAGLPQLARGRHDHPEQGACLMEYVSVLAGLPFNDHPACTAPAIAYLARRVNDILEDPIRAELARRAPVLIGLKPPPGRTRRIVIEQLAAEGLRHRPADNRFTDLLAAVHPRRPGLLALCRSRLRHPVRTGDLNWITVEVCGILHHLPEVERDRRLIAVLDATIAQARAAHAASSAKPAPHQGSTAWPGPRKPNTTR